MPENARARVGFADTVWKFFASVQLTVVLLLSLALTSVAGTLIPQNAQPAEYLRAFGPFLFRLFHALDLFDMYHAWWFQLLMVLLVVNIVVCSVDRISANRKVLLVRRPKFSFARFQNLKSNCAFSVSAPPAALRDSFASHWRRRFRHHQLEETGGGFRLFGEKGRWTRFGVYAVHLSVVALLAGGLIGSIFGFEGFVTLAPGDSSKTIRLTNSAQTLDLGFTIRCDDFKVSFYENGAPREFRSSLTIIEGGREVLHKDIIVNDPLRYRGINIYQASYGPLPPRGARLSFTSQETGMVYQREVQIGQTIRLPEDLGTFTLRGFQNQAAFRGQPVGEAFVGEFVPSGGPPQQVLLPLRFPSFDKMRRGQVVVAVEEPLARHYTGLQVSRDPGVPVVYAGFVLIILGCYVTFFMSHRQFCLDVSRQEDGSRVRLLGTANKNKLALPRQLEALAAELARLTGEERRR